jgi:hypothetical protein
MAVAMPPSQDIKRENGMNTTLRLAKLGLLLGLVAFASACVVEPREGYWDRDHNRYYQDHGWHGCDAENNHCR